MTFDDLDKKMRVIETANDPVVLPGVYIVARIDGRGFTKRPRSGTRSRRRSTSASATTWWKRRRT